jgi:hypothetical protein
MCHYGKIDNANFFFPPKAATGEVVHSRCFSKLIRGDVGPFDAGWTEEDVDAVLRRNDPDELLYVPIVVGMNADSREPG